MATTPRQPRQLPPQSDPGRYVYVPRVRCPKCGSADLRVYKTLPPEADGSVSRYTRCRGCGRRFIAVEE